MAYNVSPGVYTREFDRSATVEPVFGNTAVAVITATRGPTEPTLINNEREFLTRFGEPTPDTPSMHSALAFTRRVGTMYVVRVINDASAASEVYETGATPETLLTFTAANPGTWGNDLTITLNDGVEQTYALTVSENGTDVESYEFELTVGAKNGFGQSVYIEDVLADSIYVNVVHDTTATDQAITDGDTVALTGGTDDTTPVTDAEVVTGFNLFSNPQEYDIQYLINGGWASDTVHAALVSLAETRRDCVAILDTPNDTVVADIVTFRKDTSNQNSSFAAYYAGWLSVYDTYTARIVEVAPSGHVAAVYALTQTQANPWSAPAGLRRGVIQGVTGVSKIWSEGERDLLYRAQINPIQSFPGEGVVVWGQKNSQTFASALNRMNVRFLFNYVRNSLKASLRPYVFQPNNEFTRASIDSLVTNFMDTIQNGGGVNAYRVNIISDGNNINIELNLAPTYTNEFIRLDVIAVPTAQSLE